MIEKMKKITLLCLGGEKTKVLDALRDLGVMHITAHASTEAPDIAAVTREKTLLVRAVSILTDYKSKNKQRGDESPLSPAGILSKFESLYSKRSQALKDKETFSKQQERLLPWGDFDPVSVTRLENAGLHVCFCSGRNASVLENIPDGASAEIINVFRGQTYFVIVSQDEVDTSQFTLEQLPKLSLSAAKQGITDADKTVSDIDAELIKLSSAVPSLEKYAACVNEKYDFAVASESMKDNGGIGIISGYVPQMYIEKLKNAAHTYGWALLIEDPADDDEQVPTCIVKPKFLDILDPLFDFIGISPGYRENDVNVFFLIFFPIFFGMIVGDAGYGVIFIAICLVCKIAFKKVEAARLPINLFIMLSCFSLAWGWLNGAWLGLSKDVLPEFMRGADIFSDPQNSPLAESIARKVGILKDTMTPEQIKNMWSGWNDKIIQWICFCLAAVHLCSAHIYRFFAGIRDDWRAVSNIGWACLVAANFLMAVNLIVFSGTFPTFGYYLYGIGILLILATLRLGGIMLLPFDLVGSFTDVLSYIRLFAVGLSGTYIAVNFNKMGQAFTEGRSGWAFAVAVVALVLIAVFGHLLNIALGFLSVMVHGIRLNTLEFSNHMGMQWVGIKYRPFAKTVKTQTNKE